VQVFLNRFVLIASELEDGNILQWIDIENAGELEAIPLPLDIAEKVIGMASIENVAYLLTALPGAALETMPLSYTADSAALKDFLITAYAVSLDGAFTEAGQHSVQAIEVHDTGGYMPDKSNLSVVETQSPYVGIFFNGEIFGQANQFFMWDPSAASAENWIEDTSAGLDAVLAYWGLDYYHPDEGLYAPVFEDGNGLVYRCGNSRYVASGASTGVHDVEKLPGFNHVCLASQNAPAGQVADMTLVTEEGTLAIDSIIWNGQAWDFQALADVGILTKE
jgi:hypothetical protein